MLQRVWTAPWGGGESQWGNLVGRIDLLQSAVGEFAKGCIALSIAEGLKTAKKQVYIFGKRTTEKMHGQKTALGLA